MSARRRVASDEKRRSRRSYPRHRSHDELWGPQQTCLTPEEHEWEQWRAWFRAKFGYEPRRDAPKGIVIEMLGYDRLEDAPPPAIGAVQYVDENPYAPDEDVK